MSSKLRTHKDLVVWQKALSLSESTFRCTAWFPAEERFGLSVQMRRAAVSVLSNIAEGAGRQTTREYLQFLCVARGSLNELDAQITLTDRLGWLPQETNARLASQVAQVAQLLNALIVAIRRRVRTTSNPKSRIPSPKSPKE